MKYVTNLCVHKSNKLIYNNTRKSALVPRESLSLDLDAKSDLKIMPDEISRGSSHGVEYLLLPTTHRLCFNEQTFNQQFGKQLYALSAGQSLGPLTKLHSPLSSLNRFPNVSQIARLLTHIAITFGNV